MLCERGTASHGRRASRPRYRRLWAGTHQRYSASGVCDAAFTLRARFPGVGSLDAYGAPQDVPIPRAGRAVGVAASRVARLAT